MIVGGLVLLGYGAYSHERRSTASVVKTVTVGSPSHRVTTVTTTSSGSDAIAIALLGGGGALLLIGVLFPRIKSIPTPWGAIELEQAREIGDVVVETYSREALDLAAK